MLWVLGEAKRRGFVTEVGTIIDELLAMGYWLHPERVSPQYCTHYQIVLIYKWFLL
jgi:predicted nucleic acid-binding protein